MPIDAVPNQPFYCGNSEVDDFAGVNAVEYHAQRTRNMWNFARPDTRVFCSAVTVRVLGQVAFSAAEIMVSQLTNFFAALSPFRTSRTPAGDCC